MIFNKDKRPTKSGWYWATMDGKTPQAVKVFFDRTYRTAHFYAVDRTGQHNGAYVESWGDEIPLPTVDEQP